ncbi:MAG: isochorismatase family protein [Planctomycetota bacterium]|nr:isochorismatase family protein [Planctomycetota bacterium]
MAYERWNADNAALLLIDHQVGTIGWMHSTTKSELKRNTLALARSAKAVGMRTVLTSSMEDQFQGPLFPGLAEILPQEFSARVKRSGIVDAFDDSNFKEAVEATGKRKLIIAGLLTEVCVVYPTLSALSEGYEVQVVADASGSATPTSDSLALDRIRQAGGAVVSTVQIMSEMVENWAEGAGPKVMPILGELYSAIE